jgi:hypothetical protein
MNDFEEVRFGMLHGASLVLKSKEIINALKTQKRIDSFTNWFNLFCSDFDSKQVMDTYIFCLSEHVSTDINGLLSMWRGYGCNGNGVAIVFDTAKVSVMHESPLIIAKVNYASTEGRIEWLNDLILKFATILNNTSISDDKLLYLAALELFERIKIFALFTKHDGFKEEREWRIVYLVNRDRDKKLEPMFNYWIGPNGIQPKLHLKVNELSADLSLTKLVDRIILGPSISLPMAKATIFRMLDKLGKS